MGQCVPDWDADRSGGGGGGGGGGCSPAIPGSTGDLVPRDQWGHADNDPFTCTTDDFWPWWDWDLDDVAELKWADGQPGVVLQAGAAASMTPTPTPPAILTPPDADDDLDLDRCLWAEGRHPADAIVPGSTAPVPAAADAADSTSGSVLVPDVTTAPAQPAANSISLAGAARKRPPPPPPAKAGEAIMGGVKRQRRHLQEKGRRHDDNPAGICPASAPHKARCRSALSERKRRDKFNQKIQTLQKLLPNCAKVDKVSILDEVITHVRQLQAQTQMHIMTAAASTAALPSVSQVQPPIMNMMPPPATPMAAYMHQQFQIMAQMAAQMSQMLRSMGLAGTNGFFPHPPPTSHLINLISSSHPTLIPIAEQPGMAPRGSSRSRSNRQAFAASFAPPPTKQGAS